MMNLESNTKRPAFVAQSVSDWRCSDATDKVANHCPLVHGGTQYRATIIL